MDKTSSTSISQSLTSISHDSAMLSGCRICGVMPIGWRLTGGAIRIGDAAIGRTMVLPPTFIALLCACIITVSSA